MMAHEQMDSLRPFSPKASLVVAPYWHIQKNHLRIPKLRKSANDFQGGFVNVDKTPHPYKQLLNVFFNVRASL